MRPSRPRTVLSQRLRTLRADQPRLPSAFEGPFHFCAASQTVSQASFIFNAACQAVDFSQIDGRGRAELCL